MAKCEKRKACSGVFCVLHQGSHSHEKSKDVVVYFFVALIKHEIRVKYKKCTASLEDQNNFPDYRTDCLDSRIDYTYLNSLDALKGYLNTQTDGLECRYLDGLYIGPIKCVDN